MSLSDVFAAGDWKKVLLALYEEYIYPALKDLVLQSDNSWDDQALAIADGLLRDLLK